LDIVNQAEIAKKILSEAETDMKVKDVIKFASANIINKKTKKEYLTLPGSIQEFDDRKMLIPDLNEYNIQRIKLLYYENSKQLQFEEHKKIGFGGKK